MENKKSTDADRSVKKSSWFILVLLMVAGETVFLLPFVLPRIFRPTMLDVFQINNFQLGSAFSIYGVIAMASYFLGGPLADRFSAKHLMGIALLATGLGGLVIIKNPSVNTLFLLYGFWGLTTIFLFWAALIRAAREWGGKTQQGIAFGFLDGGRGLVAALIGSLSAGFLAFLLPNHVESATLAERSSALSMIILVYSIFTMVVGVLIILALPSSRQIEPRSGARKKINWSGVVKALKLPSVWYHALIVLCAYVGYKCTDDFTLFAYDAYGFNEVDSAKIGTISFWTRPIAAVLAGILADRITSSQIILWGFLLMLLGSITLATDLIPMTTFASITFIFIISGIGIYGLRGIYFALLQEAKVPMLITGAAIGIVSFIGYTPDIFMGPLMGLLIDNNPGALGHQYLFACLAGFSSIGIWATWRFRQITRMGRNMPENQ